MNLIEKHGKKIALALCFATCIPVISTVYAYEAQPGWHGEGAERYYVLETTRAQATGWLNLDEGTYYFDETGEMLLGWQTIDGFRYYFESDGTMAIGEQTIDEVRWNFQKDGRLFSGWQEDALYDEHGFLITECFMDTDEGMIYVNAEGRKATGWQTIEGKRYYFDENGIRQSGTIDIDGERYTLDEDGVLQTGWSYDDAGNARYRDEHGMFLRDAALEIDGINYIFDEEGIAMDEAEARRQSGAGIAEAALAQVGTAQDCTMLVTNALAANGIYYHGWPAGYMSLGTVTDDPQPGDLIYYADGGMGMAHIAVYIGNGQAVHGGYNGNETVVASAYLGSGPVFIHIG